MHYRQTPPLRGALEKFVTLFINPHPQRSRAPKHTAFRAQGSGNFSTVGRPRPPWVGAVGLTMGGYLVTIGEGVGKQSKGTTAALFRDHTDPRVAHLIDLGWVCCGHPSTRGHL